MTKYHVLYEATFDTVRDGFLPESVSNMAGHLNGAVDRYLIRDDASPVGSLILSDVEESVQLGSLPND